MKSIILKRSLSLSLQSIDVFCVLYLPVVRSQSLRTQSQLSAFDQDTLNMPQFVQLTETFLGDLPLRDVFESLVKYVHEGYDETEEEKMERLRKVSTS